jgi:hypothetical protein
MPGESNGDVGTLDGCWERTQDTGRGVGATAGPGRTLTLPRPESKGLPPIVHGLVSPKESSAMERIPI